MGRHIRLHSTGLELELEDDNTMCSMSEFWKKKAILTSRLYLSLAREEGRGIVVES